MLYEPPPSAIFHSPYASVASYAQSIAERNPKAYGTQRECVTPQVKQTSLVMGLTALASRSGVFCAAVAHRIDERKNMGTKKKHTANSMGFKGCPTVCSMFHTERPIAARNAMTPTAI